MALIAEEVSGDVRISIKYFCIFTSFLYAAFLHFYFLFYALPYPIPFLPSPTSFSHDCDASDCYIRNPEFPLY